MVDRMDPGGLGSGDEQELPDDGPDYSDRIQEIEQRFERWAAANNYEIGTGLREEVERFLELYRIDLGDVSGLPELTINNSKSYLSSQSPEVSTGYIDRPIDPRSFDFAFLIMFALDRGYTITSTLGGQHSTFNFHTDGRAIDIRSRGLNEKQLEDVRQEFKKYGVRLYDETKRDKWTPNTTGSHFHFDTGTMSEVVERGAAKARGAGREDIGLTNTWPARLRP